MLKIITKTVRTDWATLLSEVMTRNAKVVYELEERLAKEREMFDGIQEIFPPEELIFRTFNFFPVADLKVVILGQDPYHGKGQAMGMCFSVPNNVKIPPSLVNIYKEIKQNNSQYVIPTTGNLTSWNEQGVLLLNTSLTVRQSSPNCHQKYWYKITNDMIKEISNRTENIVFLLWGNHAISKKRFIHATKHHIIESKHPSPLSANRGGWFGTRPFQRTNEYLRSINKSEIHW